MSDTETFTAFAGQQRVAAGDLLQVATGVASSTIPILIFNDATGGRVELDLRHGPERAVEDHLARTVVDQAPRRQGRGRPRLGVVAREVTLLPRHWDWLASQPGGASATLRRLVEDARRAAAAPDRAREAREALYRVMSALAGDLPAFEEAARALFAGDDGRFDTIVAAWPPDLAGYLGRLAIVERAARAAV